MSGYRFYNPAPVFLDLLGLAPLAGGSLTFYELGTTTAKDTWSDSGLTILNPNPVPLDSAGRPSVNVWCDGAYSVTIKSAAGVTVETRDIDSGIGAGLSIPALTTAGFLTHDFSNLMWAEFPMLPDPSGSDGMVPVANGGGYTLAPMPSVPSLPIVDGASSQKIGTMLIQWGSSSAPPSGARQTGVGVAFPTAFDAEPFFVGITVRNNSHTAGGQLGVAAVVNKDANGFGVHFDTDDFGQSNASFINAIPFDWIAFGRKA